MWENNIVTSNHVQASNGGLVVRRVVIMAVAVTENIVPVAVQRSHLNLKGLYVSAGVQRRGGKKSCLAKSQHRPPSVQSKHEPISVCLPACLPVCLSLSRALSANHLLLTPFHSHRLPKGDPTGWSAHLHLCQSHGLVCRVLVVGNGAGLTQVVRHNDLVRRSDYQHDEGQGVDICGGERRGLGNERANDPCRRQIATMPC